MLRYLLVLAATVFSLAIGAAAATPKFLAAETSKAPSKYPTKRPTKEPTPRPTNAPTAEPTPAELDTSVKWRAIARLKGTPMGPRWAHASAAAHGKLLVAGGRPVSIIFCSNIYCGLSAQL